jgi:nitrogenase molybdenum-cofactor synthesis protein NifE
MIDDLSPREMYAMLKEARADIMLSGGRSQFVALKARMPWMDINQERHHAFAGYEGMVTMVAEIDKALFNPVWQQVRTPAPWDTADTLGAFAAQAIAPATPTAALDELDVPTAPTALLASVAANALGLAPDEVPA